MTILACSMRARNEYKHIDIDEKNKSYVGAVMDHDPNTIFTVQLDS